MKTASVFHRVAGLLLVAAATLVAGCMGSDDNSGATSVVPAGYPVSISGFAYGKAPLTGATVLVKDRFGYVIGSTVTDRAGSYTVTGTGTAPFFARVTDASGATLYGIG